MEVDQDLVEILQNAANDKFTGFQLMQTVVKLTLQLQNARRVIKVTKKLDPQAFEPKASMTPYEKYVQFAQVTDPVNPPTVADKWFSQRGASEREDEEFK